MYLRTALYITDENDSPHELVQNPLHPHVHADRVEAVVPQHAEEVHDEPIALLEYQLLPVKDGHFRRDFSTK